MIVNQARTLLLNKSEASRPIRSTTMGEEYIDAGYVPKELSAYLEQLRTIIFGINPEPVFENFRLRQLLEIIEHSKYSEYITELDSRITYTFDTNEFFNMETVYSCDNTPNLVLSGDLNCDEYTGRLQYKWKITGDSTSNVTVQDLHTNKTSDSEIIYSGSGVSSDIAIPGSDWVMKFNGSGSIEADKVWNVILLTKPAIDISNMVTRLLASSYVGRLFEGKIRTEPYKTFYNLYNESNKDIDILIGVVLALIYRIDEEVYGE